MGSRGLAAALLAGALALFVAAVPASAKEGVKATLTTQIPLTAKPGTQLHVAWTLSFLENGQPRPFGAGGGFVRLLSASGAPAETAYVNGRGPPSLLWNVPLTVRPHQGSGYDPFKRTFFTNGICCPLGKSR